MYQFLTSFRAYKNPSHKNTRMLLPLFSFFFSSTTFINDTSYYDFFFIETITKKDFFSIIPEFFLLCYLLINLILLVVYSFKPVYKYISPVEEKIKLKNLTLIFVSRFINFLVFLLCTYIFFYTINKESFSFNCFLVVDSYSQISKIFTVLLFILILAVSFNFILFESSFSIEAPILLGFSLFFNLLMLSSVDFILIYFMVEALTFILSLLIATNCFSSAALEAAIKYFLVSSLASAFILFGILFVYILCGSTNFFNFLSWCYLNCYYAVSDEVKLPIFFIVLGFLIKLGAFPFNIWVPDVYEGCPLFLVFYFIVSLKTSLLLVFMRILFFVFAPVGFLWIPLLLASATGSFIIGSFGALSQTTIKRFFAYSSLNQLGFILAGFSCFSIKAAGTASLFFLLTYVLNNILFFSVLLSLLNSKTYFSVNSLSELKGLSYTHPVNALFLSVSLFSLIGLPPLAGFFSKFLILITIAKSNFFWVIILALFTNGISAYYYANILKMIWFETPDSINSQFLFSGGLHFYSVVCAFFTVFFNFFLIFFNQSLLDFLDVLCSSCCHFRSI